MARASCKKNEFSFPFRPRLIWPFRRRAGTKPASLGWRVSKRSVCVVGRQVSVESSQVAFLGFGRPITMEPR